MTTLDQGRQVVADTLNTITTPGPLVVRKVPGGYAKAFDGWVIVERVRRGERLRTFDVTFVAVVLLGTDQAFAEQAIADLATPAIAAFDQIPVADVTLEPAMVPVEGGAQHALTLTLTMEVT